MRASTCASPTPPTHWNDCSTEMATAVIEPTATANTMGSCRRLIGRAIIYRPILADQISKPPSGLCARRGPQRVEPTLYHA